MKINKLSNGQRRAASPVSVAERAHCSRTDTGLHLNFSGTIGQKHDIQIELTVQQAKALIDTLQWGVDLGPIGR